MTIDRYLWQPVWDEHAFPALPCPSCDARLNFDAKSVEIKASQYNRHLADVAGIDEVVARFSGRFLCGHDKCGEIVQVSGDCHYEYGYDERGATITNEFLHPQTMHPGPPIIRIGEAVPENIQEALMTSFSLFWTDYDACAGKLRTTLELILKHSGIEGVDANGTFVPLHQKILAYQESGGDEKIATSLMAVKWLGNVSAHESGLCLDAVLDGYEILELTLAKLFPTDTSVVEDLADRVNSTKGRAR